MKEIVITRDTAGQRADKFLARILNTAPRHFIQKMLRKKNITLNGGRLKGDYIICEGDIIRLFFSEETFAKFSHKSCGTKGTIDIIYEDDNFIVLNKPAGLLTQPDKKGADSLTERLRATYPDVSFAPVVVNRLDRNTSGIVMAAKNLFASQILSKLVHDRLIDKYYLAIVHGKVDAKQILKAYHQKDKKQNIAAISLEPTKNTKPCTVEIEPIMFHVEHSITLLKIKLITGRSHQIRAQLSSIGHPLVGDKKYGGESRFGWQNQALHAHSIYFARSYGELKYLEAESFYAPIPKDIKKIFDLSLDITKKGENLNGIFK